MLRAKLGEEEVLEGGSLPAPKEATCDDRCRMTGGLLLLAPVLATTMGFRLPGRWLLSPDKRAPESRVTVGALGIDTATSSLKRVVVDLRADFPPVGTDDSVGVGSSSKAAVPSLPIAAANDKSGEVGDEIEGLLDGRLGPELDFLRIGGGRIAVVRLFSFDLLVACGDVSKGLWGVGVTEVSSTSSLP